MNKNRSINLVLLLLWGFTLLFPRQVVQADIPLIEEVDQIEILLDNYFSQRYAMFQTLEFIPFEELLSGTPESTAFYQREQDKLVLELWQAAFYNLRHLESQYFFEITALVWQEDQTKAIVTLLEGHDVVFAASAPAVSSLRNQKHTLTLLKTADGWRIDDDQYLDHLHTVLTYGNETPQEIKTRIQQSEQQPLITVSNETTPITSQNYYQRSMAIRYALDWAISPIPYHPDFVDFTEMGGDCTNFVSQALWAAAPDSMTNHEAEQIGAEGWYYNHMLDRAIAWTWVDGLFLYITQDHQKWEGGPQGQQVNLNEVFPGDIIQYDWGTTDFWKHSVMITNTLRQDGTIMHLVAGHSPDVVNYPYTAFNYGEMRYLHITALENTQPALHFNAQ